MLYLADQLAKTLDVVTAEVCPDVLQVSEQVCCMEPRSVNRALARASFTSVRELGPFGV